MEEIKRKGARSTKDIPREILDQLNRGEIETANLVEWLAVDQKVLLGNLLVQQQRSIYLAPVLTKIDQLKKQTVTNLNQAIGIGLFEQAMENNDREFLAIMANHPADLVRCWATYTIGKNENLHISEMLDQIEPFAADTHFGVREICWMAVRPKIAANLLQSIEILARWTANRDENIRRFASEATRPRGVWCEHIESLKQNPELGLPIVERLRSDNTKYVQDSVGNWLNDASKTKASFVLQLCERWKKESDTRETSYIIKKALRTVNKS
ncbi:MULTISPECIES: DNA alkylation repair protein [unclassified Sphingobacterium]|jgi:3-methyladenine DNA glycosylase AlkC|uniref:DNA alkylation repair protein n=1 Tax=unclassified Sphingobacterium TaxID=2609468 RepID=UPI002953B0A5|nr:DNA alkylation repair protein [Sphingobacterium sp. UGAL515B_05]WON93726.1 DNA alkylation repair protein [Sphingobacterium sp. UGAL515B_05]